MTRQEELEIFRRLLALKGLDYQIDQGTEECAEYIVAVRHYRRGKITLRQFVSEMVDVELMMEQMKTCMPEDIWQSEREFKLKRVLENLNNGTVK